MAETTETQNATLESAVASAVESSAPETVPAESTETAAVETGDGNETQATGEGTEGTESTQTAPTVDPEVEKALNVYKMLNNPETAPAVIKMLAEQVGLLGEKATPKEAPKAPTAEEILSKALGEEYAFLAPKLAAGLEAYNKQVLTPIQQQLQQQAIASEYDKAVGKLNESTKGDFGKLDEQISKLMDEIKPAPGVSIEKYLNNLYLIAKSSTGSTATTPKQAAKIVERMTQNAKERIPAPSAATENRVVKGPALPSLDDAVAAALRGERFQ